MPRSTVNKSSSFPKIHIKKPEQLQTFQLSSSEDEGEENQKNPRSALKLESFREPLSSVQESYYNRAEAQFEDFSKRIDALIKSKKDIKILEKSENLTVLEYTEETSQPIVLNSGPPPNQQQTIVLPQGQSNQTSLIVQNAVGGPTQNYQLVVNPRLGVIVTEQQPNSQAAQQAVTSKYKGRKTKQKLTEPVAVPQQVSTPLNSPPPQHFYIANSNNVPTAVVKPAVLKGQVATKKSGPSRSKNGFVPLEPGRTNSTKPIGPVNVSTFGKNRTPHHRKPAQQSVVDLTDDDPSDSREITISKMSGKTYPSLVVVARPYLSTKEWTQHKAASERATLDNKVKKILMLTPSHFTEWLLQNGLLKCEQFCPVHVDDLGQPVKMKLAMYSDSSKFPYSGGYVWISDCCPTQYVSVFSGSIFEGAPHPPVVILKLLYHWACHTSIQNVIQWVKVDNQYIKSLYTNLRAVCTAATHQKCQMLGGQGKKIQVGVISLGTTTQDGNMRQVKVEVLGVLDPESKQIRIRAMEPVQDSDKNYKKRFLKILEPLQHWVYKDSAIYTDYTVDKTTLYQLGFHNVTQIGPSDPEFSTSSNSNVMEYLRKIVPRMFQNTLSLLSRPIIQQFLDELTWREKYGPYPSLAFDNIVDHLAEQTRMENGSGLSLCYMLPKISAYPFKNWKYDRWVANCKPPVPEKPGESSPALRSAPPTPEPSSDSLSSSHLSNPQLSTPQFSMSEATSVPSMDVAPAPPAPGCVYAELYFYGYLPGKITSGSVKTFTKTQCAICDSSFKSNLKLMDHLIAHALNKNLSLTGELKTLCKLCCKVMVTQASLKSHFQQIHKESMRTPTTCLICNIKMKDKQTYISHLTKTHYELELPYQCKLCGYRTSIFEDMVNHFSQVHKNSSYVCCPYCYKMVEISSETEDLSQNQYFYISHLQRHLLHSLVKKCAKCAMWFISKGSLEDHEFEYHKSCKSLEGISKLSNFPELTVMPKPTSKPTMMTRERVRNSLSSTQFRMAPYALKIPSFMTRKFNCAECECVITNNHFVAEYSCTACSYLTFCQRAMHEHTVSVHHPYTLKFLQGRRVQLREPLYCLCSFSTYSGEEMAEHLLKTCRRPACYTTAGLEELSKNPPLPEVEKSPSPEPRAEEPKTILNLLGLVKKPGTEKAPNGETMSMETEEPIKEVKTEPMDTDEIQESMAIDKQPSPEDMNLD